MNSLNIVKAIQKQIKYSKYARFYQLPNQLRNTRSNYPEYKILMTISGERFIYTANLLCLTYYTCRSIIPINFIDPFKFNS